MPLMAAAFPILPGKTEEWRKWVQELNGPRREEFVESRRRLGVRERTFLHPSPTGDLVIVTLEGDDPGRAFGQMMSAKDEFSTWFAERAAEVHGDTPPSADDRPELVLDTDGMAGQTK